ncbi:MAG: tetratricopeptide repeat-containing sulfotransferase family protein [Rhodanobacteraceae bacterium]
MPSSKIVTQPMGRSAVASAVAVPLSPVARRLLARAHLELDRGDIGEAERTLSSLLALAPDSAEAVRCLGVVALHRGDFTKVVDCYLLVLDVWPNDANLRLGLGAALFAAGAVEDSIAHLRRACALAPKLASAWLTLGEALQQSARGKEAVAALERAADLDAASVPVHLALARAYASTGEGAAAVREFREVLRREQTSAAAWFGLSNLNTHRFDPLDAKDLRDCVAKASVGTETRELLGFALGKSLEDQGDYEAAFEAFRSANEQRSARFGWNATSERARTQAIQRTFSAWGPQDASPSDYGREVIFIASIPRSGSSLIEQILASHPDVEGANEVQDLPDLVDRESQRRHEAFPEWASNATIEDWRRMGGEYLERTARWRTHKPRSTDKNLATWYLVGAALAMLPATRVIVVRRDPVETCIACYRQRLEGDAGFTANLDDMADYCVDFYRLTRFWLDRFPDRVFDLSYEQLVDKPEPTVRRLLAFCELPFNRACIEFHRTERSVLSAPSAIQVRQPLRQDTARADRYGSLLDGLRTRLKAAGLVLRHSASAPAPQTADWDAASRPQ